MCRLGPMLGNAQRQRQTDVIITPMGYQYDRLTNVVIWHLPLNFGTDN